MAKPRTNKAIPAKVSPAWPKCSKCRSSATTGAGAPPDECWITCADCGHRFQVCGARKKGSGQHCGRTAMPNGRCALHGGKSTGRPIIHGRRSKFLPVRLMERAEEALRDPDLVGLLEDIALVEALMIDKIEQLGEDSPSILWSEAAEAYAELNTQRKEGGLAMEIEAGQAFERLGEVLTRGQGQAQATKEIVGLQEHKRKLSDTEIKRQHTLNQFVSAKELNVLFAVVLTIITETVKDANDRKAVGVKLAGVLRQSFVGSPTG